MKYSNNFHKKLWDWGVPFIGGLLQCHLAFLLEFVNLIYMCSSTDTVDIVVSFAMIVLISYLDKMIYESIFKGDRL